MSLDPLACSQCRRLFNDNSLMQVETRFVVVAEGEAAGRVRLNELLAEEHAGHRVAPR